MEQKQVETPLILTAGPTYLDIDAYACCVAMAELLNLQGISAVAYSKAPCNYSVCRSLIKEGQILKDLPFDCDSSNLKYIILDVSDPDFLKDTVPLDQVVGIYDHHAGYEKYWESRLGDNAHIEFIGAAATLIYRLWKNAGLQGQMTRDTALLLIAAILDNTLDLMSSNTTQEDIEAYDELCQRADAGDEFRASYFSEVQESVESDLKYALFGDIKSLRDNSILPQRIAQISVWEVENVIARLPEIRSWFGESEETWMINVIDIKNRCSYFVCDDDYHQKQIESVFGVQFDSGIAKSSQSYLRKQIIKKTISFN